MTDFLPSHAIQPPRRKYTPEFKAKLVLASQQSVASVAAIAQQYGINANLIHKWRHAAKQSHEVQATASPTFVPVALPHNKTNATEVVVIECYVNGASCKVSWPFNHIHEASVWLKALMS